MRKKTSLLLALVLLMAALPLSAQSRHTEVTLDNPCLIVRQTDGYHVYGIPVGDVVHFSFGEMSYSHIYTRLDGVDRRFHPLLDNSYYILTEEGDTEAVLTLLFCDKPVGRDMNELELQGQLAAREEVVYVENNIEFTQLDSRNAALVKIHIHLDQ